MTRSAIRVARQLSAAIALMMVLVSSARADDLAVLYKAKCAYCHGTDGRGATPLAKKLGVRDFASPEARKETDKELIDITTQGKKNMPGYQSSLTHSQIKDLVAYVHELVKK
jgi:mono/diheme cytochrome c family protein